MAPAETIADYVENGLLRICQPARYGGYELGYDIMCEVTQTLARGWGMDVIEASLGDGLTELPALDREVSAVVLQQPNVLGAVEDLEALTQRAHEVGALTICSCDPLPLALLKPRWVPG